MSKSKTKRYLMLLATLGLVAIALGGGTGTFATFNAEVSNNNNTFASGTLYLHDTHGATACASESASNNKNVGTPYTADNGCSVLFSTTLPTAHATLGGGGLTAPNPVSSLTVSAIRGGAVEAGDEIVLDDGAGHTQKFFATAAAPLNATTITVATQNANFSYPAGTTTVTDDARFTRLQLTNAGTLDAAGIKVALGTGGCNDSPATTTTANLSGTHNAGVTLLTVSSPLSNGIPSGTSISIAAPNAETVTTTSAVSPGASTIPVSATGQSHANNTAISWSVTFTGGTALCGSLPITIVETDSSYGHDTGTPALGCAYGTPVANFGCSFGANVISSILTTPSLTPLNLLAGGSSNTSTQLDAGGSRYFVIGVQSPGSLGNGSQNEQAKFDLVWHIDQA